MAPTAPERVWLCLIVAVLLGAAPCRGQQRELHVTERRALIALHTATLGPAWKNPWTAATLATDPCQGEWPGVWCDNNGYVRRLNLRGRNLAGTIPAALGTLHMIEDLDLGENYISGTLPAKLGELTSLLNLDLSNNAISGTIPNELEALLGLQSMNLLGNQFAGGLPSAFRGRTDVHVAWDDPPEL